MKMRYYFDDYGCLRCGKSNVIYRANGLSEGCTVVVRRRILRAFKKRFRKIGVPLDEKPVAKFVGVGSMKQILRRAHYHMAAEGPLPRKNARRKSSR
jgi:hypothetical protein